MKCDDDAASCSSSGSDDWLFDGLDVKRPPSWARIGLFGSHRSGKELFVSSVALMSSSSSSSKHAASPPPLHEESPVPLSSPATSAAAVSSSMHLPSPATTTVNPSISEDDGALMSMLWDASLTLMECGAHCVGGTYPHPTRAHLSIVMPHGGGGGGGGSNEKHKDGGAVAHQVDIEVVNFWSFIAEGLPPTPTSPPLASTQLPSAARADDATPPTIVVLPDVALTTCDAFLVVLDLTRYDTYTYGKGVLAKLHEVFSADEGGKRDAGAAPPRRLVAAVVASTHRLGPSVPDGGEEAMQEGEERCVSSDECRALGTQWGVPVFELSLSSCDILRHRKVLEKIISRVMHLRGA